MGRRRSVSRRDQVVALVEPIDTRPVRARAQFFSRAATPITEIAANRLRDSGSPLERGSADG